MATGEVGRHGVLNVTVHLFTLKLELDNVTTRPPPVGEHFVLDPQPIHTCVRVVSCDTLLLNTDLFSLYVTQHFIPNFRFR